MCVLRVYNAYVLSLESGVLGTSRVLLLTLKGLPRWCDRFSQYGIKVSFWGSGTLKIVIYVENYPQKRCFRLAEYHPLWGGGC